MPFFHTHEKLVLGTLFSKTCLSQTYKGFSTKPKTSIKEYGLNLLDNLIVSKSNSDQRQMNIHIHYVFLCLLCLWSNILVKLMQSMHLYVNLLNKLISTQVTLLNVLSVCLPWQMQFRGVHADVCSRNCLHMNLCTTFKNRNRPKCKQVNI